MDEKQLNNSILTLFLKENRKDRRWRNIRFFLRFLIILAVMAYVFGMVTNFYPSDASESPYVALVKLEGTIEAGQSFSSENSIPLLIEAFEDEKAKGVVLSINSGGGSAVQASIIYDRLLALKIEHPDKRLIVVAQDTLASGAYLVALAADKIYVNPNTITGSIGVISKGFGFTDTLTKVGVTRRVFTAGANKDRLDPFMPLSDSDKAKMKSLLDEVHDYFVSLVKTGRQGRLNGDQAELFSGDFWTGKKAVDLGLVDGTGNLYSVLKAEFDVNVYHDYSVAPSFVQQIVRNMGVEMNRLTAPKLVLAQL